jgi:hypothetical protein
MKIDPFPGVLTAQMVDRPFTTKLGKAGCQRVKAWVLTDEQREWLCKWFPEEENSRLMKASGMSHSTLHRFAREFGLTKSEKGIKRIKKRQAAHIKRLCEKNGYYDSLRGKQLSEACRKATAQMWQEIRDGKREHPARIMKRTNPRKYREWMKRKSQERKETIRKEKLRVVYGLERKTRLKCIVLCKYTRRQANHRYNALRRGYIVMEDCSEQGGERYNIYYDSDTERAPRFEKNLLKDGFKIIQWNDGLSE